MVFSAESLADLRDADYETYLAIDRALVRWDAIDIHHGGHLIRSVGHAFSAIARPELLRLLDERAAAVGVDVRYGFPVPVEALAGRGGGGGGGLLVGADGIHSVVRDAHRAGFATLSTPHSARYVWFGTDFALPTFTFVFRPADAGLFQAHAYPFSAGASTFIVECAEEVWRRAGLDRMDDSDALAYCEALFAPWLAGRRLLFKPSAGRPMWSAFTTIRNRSWHTRTVGGDAVVLLGDAAHTAHFSIGSGTRLALDDAIALAKAFAAHPDDEAAALAAYESERQPVVERFQEAATDSARYFESVGRLLSLPPTQFALNLLTRSGRITHLELTRRDPVLVNRCDRTYAGAGQSLLAPAPAMVPLRLGGAVIANRMVLSPETTDAAAGGVPGPEARWALVEAAGFGAGLVVTEAVAPSPEGRVTSGSAGIWSEAQQRAWAGIVAEVQAAGALVALRLTHAGRRGGTRPRHRGLDRPLPAGQGWPLWGPSAVPYAPHSRLPRPVDDAAMVELR
ncbi:MAG: FAD-dependent monooxygenase, partial [Acidimicrobiia bacterium]